MLEYHKPSSINKNEDVDFWQCLLGVLAFLLLMIFAPGEF